MSQYRTRNPYNPGYALPDNVLAEPPGRNTIATVQRQRRTFDSPGVIPQAWRTGYALPDYVEAEPLGRGAISTYQRPRKTIPTLIPNALGDDSASSIVGSSIDPFKQYGMRVSEMILGSINEVPLDMRQIALKSVLNELEPGLYARVSSRAVKYKNRGMEMTEALGAAIASSVSEGLAKEVIQVGKSGKLPPRKSLMGLGIHDGAYEEALSGLWSSIKSGASTVKKKVTSGVSTANRKYQSGLKSAYKWGKKTLKKAKNLTCKVMNNPLSDVAVAGASAAYGVPPQVGTAGKQIVQGAMCPPGTQPVLDQQQLMEPQGLPKWLIPVGVGAAGLVAVLLVTQKR